MDIKTGYFAKTKYYIELGYKPLGIVQFRPKWYSGDNLKAYAPSLELFNAYKNNKISSEEFCIRYKEQIDKYTLRYFKQKIGEYERKGVDKIVLLCFEKSTDVCHRHILAKKITEELGIECKEL